MKYIMDIECNGLLETVTKVHCLTLLNIETGEVQTFADQAGYSPIISSLNIMNEAEIIAGHNLDGYDLPALEKVLGWKPNPKTKIHDTLVMARLAYSNLFEREIQKVLPEGEKLGYRHGSHSLKAWGIRLGELKGDFAEDEDKEKAFDSWSPEMQEYNIQDCKVNLVLYKKLLDKDLSEKSLEIEHEFNRVIQQQMLNGIGFDSEKAKLLADELQKEINKIERWVVDNIQPKIIKLKTKEKVVPFNIGSTDQVAEYFKAKYGWEPKAWTPTQKPKVDGEVLAGLNFPEAKIFRDYHDRSKILGFLTEGKNSWLKAVKDDSRIYGYVSSNGQLTGRVTMSKPNMGQIPKEGVFKGAECRSLFIPRPGFSLVDCDASGIQLRMLGHYLYKYDAGNYGKLIVSGDPHEANRVAAGLKNRPQAKEWIYAFLFGAGQQKLGSIALPEASAQEQRNEGKALKNRFMTEMPAFSELLFDCKRIFNERGYLKALDGRIIYPRGDYKFLNSLLQSGEAVVMKLACNLANRRLKEEKIDYYQVAYIHDEILLEVREGQEVEAGKIVKDSIKRAGEELNLKIELDGEYQIGKNWSEVH